jgi:hypothetical protein
MLEKTNQCGTGEHLCKTSSATRLKLNNTEISHEEAEELKFKLQKHFLFTPHIRLEFSDRHYPRRWGSAWVASRRIKIYRHSVEVVLHELAHVLVGDPREHHGKRFAATLDKCIAFYIAESCKATPKPSPRTQSIEELARDTKYVTKADVSIVGSWVWVKFNSKPDEEIRAWLKARHYRWNPKREVWQFAGSIEGRHRSPMSNEYLRLKYGSADVEEE